jgi:hypothetical protein
MIYKIEIDADNFIENLTKRLGNLRNYIRMS